MGIKCVLVLFLLGVSLVQAQLPRMTVVDSGRRQDLELQRLELEVNVQGRFAETTMTVSFFNETKSNQEGEFTLPLPEGATVSNYALEVNGSMREATVVEKERAVNAYERIKSRNVDPGIVTREEGNVYRTKIFPVLPKQSKSVRIGYVHELQEVDGKLVYVFPFNLDKSVGKVRMMTYGDVGKVSFPKEMGTVEVVKDASVVERENVLLHGELKLEGKIAPKKSVRGQAGDEVFVDIYSKIPERVLKASIEKPKTISILWDSSVSGYRRDLKKEMEVLDLLFKRIDDVQVELISVELSAYPKGVYQVKGGDWSELKKRIQEVEYAGAANWASVDFKAIQSERILLVGSGNVHLPLWSKRLKSVMHVLNSEKGSRPDPLLAGMSEESGGAVLDLNAEKKDEVVNQLLKLYPRLIEVKGYFDSTYVMRDGHQVRIIGKCASDRTDGVRLVYGVGQKVLYEMPLRQEDFASLNGDLLRKAWSQRKLAELESETTDSAYWREEILRHCQKYHLVSDTTAMIVLERFEDHVRFEIPPPEKDLLARYQRAVRMKRDWNSSGGSTRGYDFSVRMNWYSKEYPWMEYLLYPRYIRVNKWTKAQASVFTKPQLQATNHKIFLQWQDEVKKLVRDKQAVKTKADMEAWTKKLDELSNSGGKLKDAPIPEFDGEFAVSVRGLVNESKTVVVKNGTTLKQAIELAGGVYDNNIGSRVAIYRNADRTIYNPLSKEYKPQALKPGDMVVVMPSWQSSWDGFSGDPFADAGIEPFATEDAEEAKERAGRQEAVEQEGLPLMDANDYMNPSLLGGGSGGRPPVGKFNGLNMGAEVQEVKPQQLVNLDDEKLLKSKDLWQAYLQLKGGASRDVKLKVARLLYERKDAHNARRLLSSMYVLKQGVDVQGMRSAAYHMIALGDGKGADELLGKIQQAYPGDDLVFYDRWVALGRTNKMYAKQWLENCVGRYDILNEEWRLWRDLQSMEMIRMQLFPAEDDYRVGNLFVAPVFSSDVRIVVSSSNVDEKLSFMVMDPVGVSVGGNSIGTTGAWCAAQNGIGDYMVRRAMPGIYRLKVFCTKPTTYLIQVYTHWGKAHETRKVYVYEAAGAKEFQSAGNIEFSLKE